MRYNQEKIGNVMVLRIEENRFDDNVSPEFKTELLRLVEKQGEDKILVDLSQVDYADSSGLGALLFAQRQLKSNSGCLKLLHLSPKIQTLLKIAKLEGVLEGFDEEREALASF